MDFVFCCGGCKVAYLVVLIDAEAHDVFPALDFELLVDLVFDGKAVTIPAEAAGDVMTGGTRETSDDIFDGSRENVAVMGQAGGEGWAVVEDVLRAAFAASQLLLERISLLPVPEDSFFLFSD